MFTNFIDRRLVRQLSILYRKQWIAILYFFFSCGWQHYQTIRLQQILISFSILICAISCGLEMAKVQLIQEWNDIVEYKISENDLIKPSQEFFFKALESLLRSLNVNVDYMKANSPEGDEERTFKIRFCKYINRLYKLYDPANNFYYMDLIQPSESKCNFVLNIYHTIFALIFSRKEVFACAEDAVELFEIL